MDLAALARNACAEYAQAAWQRGDELEVSAPDALLVRGHPVLLDLLLRNLIENALKHTLRAPALPCRWARAVGARCLAAGVR